MIALLPPPEPNRTEHPFVGRLRWHGLMVNVENEHGSVRRGADAYGKPWAVRMVAGHYGEFARGERTASEGGDGEPLDVYIGPGDTDEKAPFAYVVRQLDPTTGLFDEWKVMCGYAGPLQAKGAYLNQYDGPGYFGGMVTMTYGDLIAWVRSGVEPAYLSREPVSVDQLGDAVPMRPLMKGRVLVRQHIAVNPDGSGVHIVHAHERTTVDSHGDRAYPVSGGAAVGTFDKGMRVLIAGDANVWIVQGPVTADGMPVRSEKMIGRKPYGNRGPAYVKKKIDAALVTPAPVEVTATEAGLSAGRLDADGVTHVKSIDGMRLTCGACGRAHQIKSVGLVKHGYKQAEGRGVHLSGGCWGTGLGPIEVSPETIDARIQGLSRHVEVMQGRVAAIDAAGGDPDEEIVTLQRVVDDPKWGEKLDGRDMKVTRAEYEAAMTAPDRRVRSAYMRETVVSVRGGTGLGALEVKRPIMSWRDAVGKVRRTLEMDIPRLQRMLVDTKAEREAWKPSIKIDA